MSPMSMRKLNLKITSKLNRSFVLALIHRHPMISRSELAKMTGLDRSTITHILNDLLEEELVEEVRKGKAGSRGGRCPILLRIRYDTRCIIALDVGTERIEGVITNLNGEEMDRVSLPIYRGEPLLDILCQTLDRLQEVNPDRFQRSVVIGLTCPGVIDANEGIVRLNLFHDWREVPVAKSLGEKYGKFVFLENDANAAAMGELQNFAAHGIRSMIYLLIRECPLDREELLSFGGAIILDGNLWHGCHNYAGEVSQTVNSLLRTIPVQAEPSLPSAQQGAKRMTFDDLLRAAVAKDAHAEHTLNSFIEIIGRFLNELVAFLDPEGVMVYVYPPQGTEDFLARIQQAFLHRQRVNGVSSVQLLHSTMEEPAILHGMIALAQQRIFVRDVNRCSVLFQ